LVVDFGATAADGDTTGFVLGAVLSAIRRGPVRLAFSWPWVSVHTTAGREFGFGDPKVFVRARVVGRDSSFAAAWIEGAARLPVANPHFFPFASGGQELELAGTLLFGHARGTRLGVGYIWSEPPSGGVLSQADVPHSLHLWGSQSMRLAAWVARARVDVLHMKQGRWRQQAEASLTLLAAPSLRPSFAVGCEFGPDADRATDAFVSLRFAMPLR
jgi:hypothetical protein